VIGTTLYQREMRLGLTDQQAAIDLVTQIDSRIRNKSKINNDRHNVVSIEKIEEISETIP
jgi:hypothetical protein